MQFPLDLAKGAQIFSFITTLTLGLFVETRFEKCSDNSIKSIKVFELVILRPTAILGLC